MAVRQDVALYRGEDVTLTVTMRPATAIGGWSITFTAKAKPDGAALITKPATITDPTNGIFTVPIASSDTNNPQVPASDYVYDIFRTDTGAKTCLALGKFSVLADPSYGT
jgi:hypothetical protein